MNIDFPPSVPPHCSESFKKGCLFERYVHELFNERNFKVSDWRSSIVISDKQLPRSYFLLPDFEFLFIRNKTHRFAVECKWRQEFIDGKIQWAEEDRIIIYNRYQRERNIKVFIAIGIGGLPSNPEKLFVTPLDVISKSSEVGESDLLPFKRKPTRRFFYDTVQLLLF